VQLTVRTARCSSGDRRRARFVRRALLLFALTVVGVGVGGSAIGSGPVATAGTAAGPERSVHARARLASHPVSVLTESIEHRASEQSRTDAVEPGATTRAVHDVGRRARRGSVTYRHLSPVTQRVPGRGPPRLHVSG
jgi:hypothetical protein